MKVKEEPSLKPKELPAPSAKEVAFASLKNPSKKEPKQTFGKKSYLFWPGHHKRRRIHNSNDHLSKSKNFSQDYNPKK